MEYCKDALPLGCVVGTVFRRPIRYRYHCFVRNKNKKQKQI